MKKGFTLAETLITLGIIGVVAALTIPTLIEKYQKKVTVNQIKAAYSLLQQAVQASEADNGDITGWEALDASAYAEKYLLPYLKVAKRCGSYAYNHISSGCFPDNDSFYKLDGKILGLGGSCRDPGWWDKSVLSNGMLLAICAGTGEPVNAAFILVDVNGFKGKSIVGKDVFGFKLFANYKQKLVPGSGGYTIPRIEEDRDIIINNKYYGCNNNTQYYQYDCTALIAKDGWEIKDDYPW